jgi:hypothetical protein
MCPFGTDYTRDQKGHIGSILKRYRLYKRPKGAYRKYTEEVQTIQETKRGI